MSQKPNRKQHERLVASERVKQQRYNIEGAVNMAIKTLRLNYILLDDIASVEGPISTNIVLVFQQLFKIWEGTENADEILEDACRTFGIHFFDLDSKALEGFARRCRGN